MSSRVAGAGLALIAVALLAISVATPAVLPAQLSLFAGHPTVLNHTRNAQDMYVGLYSAQLCNTGGDGTCKSGDATIGFRLCGYAELALTGGLVLLAVSLSLLTLRRSESRKSAARLIWLVGGLAIAAGAGLVLQGPFKEASVPIGLGMALHGAGVLGAMIAGGVASRPPPPIRLRVGDRPSQPLAALPTAQAFDRRAARDAAADRAAELGFEPRTRPPPPPLSIDGEPASDPFGPAMTTGDRGLPSQLRPLYEAAPLHGGTGGLLPVERPMMPAHPPVAQLPRAAQAMAAVPAMPGFGTDPSAVPLPYADAEPHAAGPPPFGGLDAGDPGGDEMRTLPPGFGGVTADLRPTLQQQATGHDRPTTLAAAAEGAAIPPPFADDPRQTAPRFSGEQRAPAPRTLPPPLPPQRSKSPSMPPPVPGPPSPPPPPLPGAQIGHKPRTQVSLVPPMPDNDLPIAPPTALFAPDPAIDVGSSTLEPTQFARPETPLAPPPAPLAVPPPPGPRARNDSQLPPPLRGNLPRPPVRAAVPMPARPGRPTGTTQPPPTGQSGGLPPGSMLPGAMPPASGSGAMPPASGSGILPPGVSAAPRPGSSTQPPTPSTLRGVPLRPTISTTVPPIPTIPPIPAPRRAETDVTDPEGHAADDGDIATVARVPIEVGDYDSQTHVSVDMPVPDDAPNAAAAAAGAGIAPDTSPSGELVVPRHAVDPSAIVADQPTLLGAAVIAAARPTVQIPGQSAGPGPGFPLPRTVTPARDRPMPNLPISTAPESLPPPKDHKQALGPSPACPQCESPMAWVEEHLRFYCKSCRMYF